MMCHDEQQNHLFILQSLIVSGIAFGTLTFNLDDFKWTTAVARYILYLMIIRGCEVLSWLVYTVYYSCSVEYWKVLQHYRKHLVLLLVSTLFLVYSKQKLVQEDLPFLFAGYLAVKYIEMADKSAEGNTINYGVGMACSFFEGYLTHIIPSDGAHFVGFEENINRFEASQGVVFPVKRLFLVITKSLYCPPDMKAFNKPNRDDLPYMEALKSLEDVEKDVAGVKNRTYRNSAYKIYRPGGGQRPVCVTAEFATPLHTLYKALQKQALYDKLANADVPKIVEDFCTTLKETIERSPECRGKCELVYYDDKDPEQNLADVLLDKIKEIEPKFEEIIAKRLAMISPNRSE